jgi:hypothetical protein
MSETEPINFDRRVAQYVQLRDKIREIEKRQKEELAPYKGALDKLGDILLTHLNDTNQERAGSAHGTAYKSTKDSCSIADKELFWEFAKLVGGGDPRDMVDIKANVTAIRDYMEKEKLPVPGVNFSSVVKIGVVRANGKE